MRINPKIDGKTAANGVLLDSQINRISLPFPKLSQDSVSKIAVDALAIDLFIRGGLTIGKLYHESGVVFGEAMVDAHRLEAGVAMVPRVAISSRIYAEIPPERRTRMIQDADGIWHLDYFSNMLAHVAEEGHKDWIRSCTDLVGQNIRAFESAEKWNEYAKWSLFKGRFSPSTS